MLNIDYDIFEISHNFCDIDMLFNITNKKFTYLLKVYNKLKNRKHDDNHVYFNNYIVSFLLEDIITSKHIKYRDLLFKIVENNDYINIITYLDQNQKILFYDNLIEISFDLICENNKIIEPLYNFLTNDDHIKSIVKTKHWKYIYEKNNFIDSYIDYLIINSSIDTKLYDFIYKLIKNKNIRTSILLWFKNYYNINKLNEINYSTIEAIEKYNETNSNKKIYLTNVLFNIWNKGITLEKICNIPLEKNNSQNFITQGYYLINDLINISLINLYNEIDLFNKDIKFLETELSEIEISEINDIDIHKKFVIETQLFVIKKMVSTIQTLLSNNDNSIVNISNYYNNVIYMLSKNLNKINESNLNIIEDLINNFSVFYKNNTKLFEYIIDDSLFICAFNFLKEECLLKNPSIKICFIDVLNYFSSRNNKYYLNFINNNLYSYLKILLKNYLYFENSLSESQIVNKIVTQSNIICLFIDLFNYNSNTKYIFKDFSINNEILINKFLNVFLGNFMIKYDEVTKYLKLIKEEQNNNQINNQINNDESISKLNLKVYNSELYNYLLFLKTICKYTINNLLAYGNKDKFCNSINVLLDILAGKNKNDYNIKNKKEYKFDPLLYLELLYNIFSICKDNEIFNEIFCELKYENIYTMNNIIYNKCLHHKYDYISIDNYYNLLKNKALENENLVYPDEFCDPLMATLIKTPVYLPNCDIVMDKDVIMRHLISEEYNPFNREKLTIEILENYNKQESVLQKIREFDEKKISWKKSKK